MPEELFDLENEIIYNNINIVRLIIILIQIIRIKRAFLENPRVDIIQLVDKHFIVPDSQDILLKLSGRFLSKVDKPFQENMQRLQYQIQIPNFFKD